MRLQEHDGLLLVTLTITHHGLTQTVDNVVLDTGAAHSLLNMDSLNIEADPATDEFVFMSGIGGREATLRKQVDAVRF